MKFTPGPWKVDNFGGQPCIVPADAEKRAINGIYQSGEYIATIHDTTGKTKTANARLIAACPVMLDILQTVNAYFYEYRNGELSGYEHELAGQVGALVAMIDGPEE